MGLLDEFTATNRVYAVCLVHLILCILMIVEAPGDKVLKLGATRISPALQWANTSFSLVSIFCIIQAVVGSLYFIESHLSLYWYLLIASVLGDVGLLGMFVVSGVDSAPVAAALACSILFKMGGLYVVSKSSKTVRNQYTAELLPHLKSALGRSFRSESQSEAAPSPSATQVPSSGYGSLGKRTGVSQRPSVSIPATSSPLPVAPAPPASVRTLPPGHFAHSMPAVNAVPSTIAPTKGSAGSQSWPQASPPGSRSLVGIVA
ncbi:unnamed protein product [Polarella glacialis]|uniref:Uncharacterized protein n=1 Tax=Polarella glacialis TaxID=89957 RepID=A0A813JC19_POLGL|nr:unnamed protein product [Polarella glacialis]CAE8670434.1 unnamed protein product [Polarella glacialis]|mmetsp:Transcript_70430/g.113557  ORF Transcript_70430/g.113557 Transcript_70430/m.113557 type:complete len:261 (+) Transcript_70430:74-856(+)